jgi:hypothetical protein
VHFGGARILVSLRRDAQVDAHIYEIAAAGGEPRQLTFAPGVSDIDPLYLPSGDIAFSSTREPKYCMCNRHIMANLFRMHPDGTNIHQIGKSTLMEGHGSLTHDGRILYNRWEYVDRNFGDAQGLWTVYPDGTNHAVYWGNNTASPGAVVDPRIIPGTEQVVCTFTSCHDRPWGAIAIVDRRIGVDGKPPVLRIWPPNAMGMVMQGNYDRFIATKPKYEDPYPLSDKYFLAARQVQGEQMGIVLLDLFGNEVLLRGELPEQELLDYYNSAKDINYTNLRVEEINFTDQKLGDKILKMAQDGKDFNDIVKELPDAGSEVKVNELGYDRKLNRFFDVKEVGAISKIVNKKDGTYSVLKIEELHVIPFDSVRNTIKFIVESLKNAAAYKKYAQKLAREKNYNVEIVKQ